MKMKLDLIDLNEAERISVDLGIPRLDRQWWTNQCIKGKFPYTTIGHKRYVRRDFVERIIQRYFDEATI